MGARFVRLGIAGFKSFADAASIEIRPGLTGIVGPNGCGKSNVAEALRWAMGEGNARHLRGGEMDDIIFAGTANRPSRNLAEVSLTVEADDTGLPSPFVGQAEVNIVRRLERGTGSTYRANGREVRARDVQTLFADLASGARSSAMVSQGRVGALVNARPEERRAVLEEAAGIAGLHARRAEAEMRLRATEVNLERATERRTLLMGQLGSLREQARQAARYRAVLTAALEAEAALLALQRHRATLARDTALRAVAAAESGLTEAIAAAAAGSREAEARQAALPDLRTEAADARTHLERQRARLDTLGADADRARAALAEAKQRQAQLARDLAHAESVLGDAEGAEARLIAETRQLQSDADAYPPALVAAQDAVAAASTRLRDADDAAGGAMERAAQATAESGAAQSLLQQARSRFDRVRDGLVRVERERDEARRRLVEPERVQAADDALVAAERALVEGRAALEQAEAERSSATAAAGTARQAHAQADAARHKLAAAAAALAEVLAVKDGERWPPLLDRLTVAPGLEAALGAVLGEELAAADDPAAPRHWRPLAPLPPRAVPGQSLAGSIEGPDLIARALTHIGLVATEAEGDAAQQRLQPGQSLVSKAGAVWRWDGYTVQAGTPSAAAVRLQQRNRLAATTSQLAEVEAAATLARTARDAADRREQAAIAAEQTNRATRRSTEAAVERARATALALRSAADGATTRLAATEAEWARAQPEAAAAQEALSAAEARLATMPDAAGLRREAEATRAAVATARQNEAAATRALDLLQRAHHARTARLASIGRERDDRRMRATDLVGRVTDLRARSAEAGAALAELAARPDRAVQQAEIARFGLSQATAANDAAQAAIVAAERAATDAAAAARASEHAVFGCREAVVRAEAGRDAAMRALDGVLDRLTERAPSLPPLPTVTDTAASAEDRARLRLQKLAQERDGMGPVNLRAELEAEALETDVATIDREAADLGTAIAKLRGSIGHLNREGRERLSEVFHQVDRHFQALFGRMFGGGRAHLALIGSDDPLLAGLEIYAQPPGKKLTALSLLSGGEQALTALSLIFAVFRCNPAPLCVLDEVDAPLDDANVGRFCALLTDVVQETGTRFLVVTHHQVTMAGMDRLYGVTMQERGVSRLLSVDLGRAMGMIEAVAAE